MWDFLRRRPAKRVEVGMTFERSYGNSFREFAEVVSIDSRLFGLPHVRFNKYYATGDWRESGGLFVLSLESFASMYQPSSEAPPVIESEAIPAESELAVMEADEAKEGVVLDFQRAKAAWKDRQDQRRRDRGAVSLASEQTT
jgi:hypothetical protein